MQEVTAPVDEGGRDDRKGAAPRASPEARRLPVPAFLLHALAGLRDVPGRYGGGSGDALGVVTAEHQALPLGRAPGTQSRLRRSIGLSLADGMFGEVVTACTTGATLTAWALYLGGSPLFLGLVAALPFLAQFLHLPASVVSEWLGRRRTALGSWWIARGAYALLIPLPFLDWSLGAKQAVLFSVALVAAVFGVLATNAWTAWMGDLVPRALRGRYFGRRHALAMLGGAVGSLGSGALIDGARRGDGDFGLALSLVALMVFSAGMVSTACLSRQHEPSRTTPKEPIDWSLVLRPLVDPAARPMLRYQLAWSFSVALSATFVAMYMAVNLKLAFRIIAAHAVAAAVMRVICSPLWGRVVDVLGARPVLVFCSYGISCLPFIFFWTTPSLWWLIWLDAFISGALWSGHAVASFALPFRLAPPKGRTGYLAAFTAAAGLGYGVASTLGGVIAGAVPEQFSVSLGGYPLTNIHVLFALSFVLRLSSASLARKIVEPDSHDVPELVDRLSGAVGRTVAQVGRLAAAPLKGAGVFRR